MARPRLSGRKDLPDNLHPVVKQGVTYYSYRNPNTGTRTGFGTVKARAVKAAKRMNATLLSEDAAVTELVTRAQQPMEVRRSPTLADRPFNDYLTHFKTQVLPHRRKKNGKPLSAKTLQDYHNQIAHMQASELGPMSIGFLGSDTHSRAARKVITQYLSGFGKTSANRRRGLLVQILRQAIGEGECDRNNAEDTIKHDEDVKRQRLPYWAFEQIHHRAPAWYQRVMSLALQSLQRREDLVVMPFTGIVEQQLRFVQQKSGRAIAINIGPELAAIIAECRDHIPSPYLLHYRPIGMNRKQLESKNHWTSITEDKATRTFSEIRDELGLFADLPARERPSFHEIRALEANMYRKAGWDEADIQQLLGHKDAETTQVYLDRHKQENIEYHVVESGLALTPVTTEDSPPIVDIYGEPLQRVS